MITRFLSHLNDTNYLLFVVARIVGIGLRPLILFVASYFLFDDFANNFAILLTAIASSFIFLSNDAHIDFYKYTFSEEDKKKREYANHLVSYLSHSISHTVLFSVPALFIFYLWIDDLFLVFICAAVLVFEKIYDEYQRFYIYSRNYKKWVINFSFRYGLPSSLVLFVILIGHTPRISIFIIGYYISFAVYFFVFEKVTLTKYKNHFFLNIETLSGYLRIYFKKYLENSLWIISSANFFLVDRYIISQRLENIAEYVFLSNMFNIVVIAHTILFFTYIRPDIIKKKCSLYKTFANIGNIIPPVFYTVGIFTVVFGLTETFSGFSSPDTSLLLLIATLFFIQAISLVLLEFVYWRVRRGYLFLVDFGLISLLLTFFEFYTDLFFELSATHVACAMVLVTVLRNCFFLFISRFARIEQT